MFRASAEGPSDLRRSLSDVVIDGCAFSHLYQRRHGSVAVGGLAVDGFEVDGFPAGDAVVDNTVAGDAVAGGSPNGISSRLRPTESNNLCALDMYIVLSGLVG